MRHDTVNKYSPPVVLQGQRNISMRSRRSLTFGDEAGRLTNLCPSDAIVPPPSNNPKASLFSNSFASFTDYRKASSPCNMALVKKDSKPRLPLATNNYYCCTDGKYLTYPTLSTGGYCCSYYHDCNIDYFNRACSSTLLLSVPKDHLSIPSLPRVLAVD